MDSDVIERVWNEPERFGPGGFIADACVAQMLSAEQGYPILGAAT